LITDTEYNGPLKVATNIFKITFPLHSIPHTSFATYFKNYLNLYNGTWNTIIATIQYKVMMD